MAQRRRPTPQRRFVPVITLGNIVSPMLTVLGLAIPAFLWVGGIDARVESVESQVSSKAPGDVVRRVEVLEQDAKASSLQLQAIRGELGNVGGEVRASRLLIEMLVNRNQASSLPRQGGK